MKKSCAEWKNSGNKYRVYLHVFPNGKKYVGSTKCGLKQRWNGGFGYENQNLIFDAICKYGWNNVRHYLLLDDLDRETALLIEASLIKRWKTYRRSSGYNSRLPNLPGLDSFIVPKFKHIEIPDLRNYSESDRFKMRSEKRKNMESAGGSYHAAIPVYCPEFDEIYCSITDASIATGVPVSSIGYCLRGRRKTAGTHYHTGEPLHWKYTNKLDFD